MKKPPTKVETVESSNSFFNVSNTWYKSLMQIFVPIANLKEYKRACTLKLSHAVYAIVTHELIKNADST